MLIIILSVTFVAVVVVVVVIFTFMDICSNVRANVVLSCCCSAADLNLYMSNLLASFSLWLIVIAEAAPLFFLASAVDTTATFSASSTCWWSLHCCSIFFSYYYYHHYLVVSTVKIRWSLPWIPELLHPVLKDHQGLVCLKAHCTCNCCSGLDKA